MSWRFSKTSSDKTSYSTKYLSILLAIITFIVYGNTMRNGYVLDDATVITNNTIVMKGISGIPEICTTPRLKGFGQGNDAESYRPVPLITHAVEWQVFGEDATASHFVNIVLFIGCVVALFLFLDRLFEEKRTTVAFIAAMIFAVHPIHTEVVANIKSRDELLCFLFAFLSLNAFLMYVREGKVLQCVAGTIALSLSLLSKETAISFLVIIPLIFFVYVNENKKRSIIVTSAMVVAAGLFFAARIAVLGWHTTNEIVFISNPLISAPDPATRFTTALLGMGLYLKQLVAPYPLLSDYSYKTIPFVGFVNVFVILSLVAYLGLIALAVFRFVRNSKDPLAFAIIFFLVTIALFTNIPFLVYSQFAERFLFFASVGICLAAALALDNWIIKGKGTERATIRKTLTFLLPIGFLFGAMTISRNTEWHDNYTLFSADIRDAPDNAKLNFLVAGAIGQILKFNEMDPTRREELDDESIGYLNKAIQIYPEFGEAHAELGRIYDGRQIFDSSMVHNIRAIELNPQNLIATYNLGRAYYGLRKYPEAIAQFRKTLKGKPDYLYAHLNLARLYLDNKQYDSAIRYFNSSLAIDPEQRVASNGVNFAIQKKREAQQALLAPKLDSIMAKPDSTRIDTTHRR